MDSKRLTAEEVAKAVEYLHFSLLEDADRMDDHPTICGFCWKNRSGEHSPGCDMATIERALADRAALEQRIQQLEGTLSLYGDEDNWEYEMGAPIIWLGPNGDGMVGKGGFMLAAKELTK